MNNYKVAVVQMDTQDDKKINLCKMELMIKEAVDNDAKLICFPEMVNVQSPNLTPAQKAESVNGITSSFIANLAKKYNTYICLGTILETIPNEDKVYNTCIFFDDNGNICDTYQKCHTFDITMKDGREFKESDTVKAGSRIVVSDTSLGKIGFGICYDLRFPEHFRAMTCRGMQLLILPASFTKETGTAHWETLLRARAIENGCYVLASNQCGHKPEYEAYGNSMIIDPFGNVLARAGIKETILYADINLDYVNEIRNQIPSTVSIHL